MRLFAATLSLALFAPFTHAATTTVGASTTPNLFPFNSYSGEYQQVYSAADFNGPITITAISFTESPQYTGSLTGNYSLYFSSTLKAINGLSTTYAANRGANNALFATGSFSTSGNTLTFTATNAFAYDPSTGNLLLDFFNNGAPSSNAAFLSGVSADTSRVFNFNGTGAPTADNMGLQTTFTYANTTAVTPEPSSLMLLGTGCTALIGLVRRRTQV